MERVHTSSFSLSLPTSHLQVHFEPEELTPFFLLLNITFFLNLVATHPKCGHKQEAAI